MHITYIDIYNVCINVSMYASISEHGHNCMRLSAHGNFT